MQSSRSQDGAKPCRSAIEYGGINPSQEPDLIQKNVIADATVTHSFSYRYVKRLLDIVFAGVGLLFLSPFLVLVGILVKIISRGDILYQWIVLGRGARPFRGYKFSTMVDNADSIKPRLIARNEMSGPVFKMEDDPRITPIGKILRKYSIDELPQLWSVLKGDMSLVGPRPAGSSEWPDYKPWQRRKLSITPGITCLWQVMGRNRISSFDEWVKLDLEYIENWSLFLDFKILLKTIMVVLSGTGK